MRARRRDSRSCAVGNLTGPSNEAKAAPTTGNQTINLSWTAGVGNVAGYCVWRGTAANTENTYYYVGGGGTTSLSDTGALTFTAGAPSTGNQTYPANPQFEFNTSGFGINSGNYYATLAPTTLTANRSYTLPDATGTICLTTTCGGAVSSIFGRTGAVVAASGDYTAAQVTNAFDLSTNNALGSHYWDATEIAAPANPGAGVDRLYLDSTSHLLSCHTSAGANCMPSGGSMVYPAAGIPNSTGSAWGTSYGVSGSGSVCLTTSCVMTTPNIGAATATSVNGTSIPSSVTLTQTIGSGTVTLPTTSIASGACSASATATITGTATTDTILSNFNGDPTATTGYAPSASGSLYMYVYPTANTVNVKVCNNTAAITPGAATLNVRVVR
jgi:hypothetical protein